MKTFTKNLGSAIALSCLALFSQDANGQCTIKSPSGTQSATISIQPVSLVVTSPCPAAGYTYNVNYNYTVSLGAGTTVNWVTGSFQCGGSNNHGFGFSGSAGSFSSTTYTGPYRSVSDCATATPTSLGCNSLNLNVQFQGEGTVSSPCALTLVGTPLPVKLLSFDALTSNNKVMLNWKTATETGNTYFILERSTNAKDWNALTKMNGDGAEHVGNSYDYTDELPQAGLNYYRIKQVDANGSATYSKILAVEAAAKAEAIAIYPNPNNGENLHFTGLQTAADWSMKVLNTTATVVYQTAAIAENVTLPNIPSGMYYVQLSNSKTGAMQVVKLMKK